MVNGPAPSTIDVGANPTYARIDLRSAGTTFEMADVTHDASPDLTISAVISNGPPGAILWNVGCLIKGGPGTLLLTATNTFSGGTVIDCGTLQLGDGAIDHDGSLGSGGITNHADLIYKQVDDQTVNYVIGGNGNLTKAGINTLTLIQEEIYTGNVAVAGGALVLWYPSLGASSAVTVALGAVIDLDFVGSNGIAS
jgi:autotransporter-associated beta strand protein